MDALPDGSAAVRGTASQRAGKMAVTVINRHYLEAADVLLAGTGGVSARALLLAAPAADAGNSLAQPDAVAPVALPVTRDGDGGWRIELPPHSMATVEIVGS